MSPSWAAGVMNRMAERVPGSQAVTLRLSRERVAQLDRIARRRGMSRSALLRGEIEGLLVSCPEEQLTAEEEAAIRQREFDGYASRRIREIGQGVPPRAEDQGFRDYLSSRVTAEALRASLRGSRLTK